MYKFEILADSVQELQQKKMMLANQWLNEPINELNKELNNKGADFSQAAQAPDTVIHFPVYTPPTNFNYDEDVSKPVEAAPAQDFQAHTQQTDVDSRGLPWDSRIHAATKAFNKDGSWRTRRGVDDTLVKQVEQDLIAKIKSGHVVQLPATVGVQVPVPQVVIPPPPAPTVNVAMPTFDQRNTATPWTNQAPAPVVQPVATAPQDYQAVQIPAGVRPAYSLSSFKTNLTVLLAALIDQGKIDQDYINQLKTYFKVKEIWNILGNEAACIEMWNMFGSAEVGYITKVDE